MKPVKIPLIIFDQNSSPVLSAITTMVSTTECSSKVPVESSHNPRNDSYETELFCPDAPCKAEIPAEVPADNLFPVLFAQKTGT